MITFLLGLFTGSAVTAAILILLAATKGER